MVEKINTILDKPTNNTTTDTVPLNYEITYSLDNSTLNVALNSLTNEECFNIELNFKLPNFLEIDEVIYRLCSFKEEQFLMVEIQEIELTTSKSSSNIYNLFKFLINYDEEFKEKLRNELDFFIQKQNQNYYDNLSTNLITGLVEKDANSGDEKIISYWTKLFNNRHLNTNEEIESQMSDVCKDADSKMAKVYHSLIHSSQMLKVLQRERNYAIDLNKLIYERDTTLRYIMDEAQLDAESVKWSAKINNLKLKQQRNFKKFLQKLYDQIDSNGAGIIQDDDDVYELNDELDTLEPFKEKFTSVPSSKTVTDLYEKSNKLEESYTIQLGAQLKTTHNLRLIRCDIFDFCKDRFNINELEIATKNNKNKNEDIESSQLEPQAIQTAMSLYSDKLCALILLVENSFNDENDSDSLDDKEIVKNEISRKNAENWHYLQELCEKNGCEFHFPTIEEQKKLAFRYASLSKENTSQTQLSNINIGDFFITRHSNLSQVHAIFHLAANEKKAFQNSSVPTSPSTPNKTLKQSDLSSRHPVILGLRNILKACSTNNINTLTLPLLLTHQMNEEMTISWVMKRAELVLKCLKGFMIEFVQWGAQDSMTIQFVVPQGLLDETFHSLSNLIPSIFRESRTVNLF